MSNPFIGEIRMFAGNFAPAGWALCQGQLIPISENDTLFNLIGTTYGGDGQENFALPDLQSRIPLHAGSNYILGQSGGVESVTLNTQQMPAHTHPFVANTALALSPDPAGNILAQPPVLNLYFGDVAGAALNPSSILPAGGSQPHENLQPYLVINFIISLFGIYPSPS
jgi:microcystin-dependent protein